MSFYLRNIAIFIIAIFILPNIAFAESLSKKQCAALKKRKQTLARAGAVKNMARGPAWAKKKLSPKALQDIKSLIGVSEQLLFRCGHRTMQHVNLRNKPVPGKKVIKKKTGTTNKKPVKSGQKKTSPANNKKQSQNQSDSSLPPAELVSFITQNPDKKKTDNRADSPEDIMYWINQH
ncbi:MAG: hypothetical protein ACRBBN_00695 [Methyloligellaceae bacterium]